MATVATRRENENNDIPRTEKIDLTPTGLLMEGVYTQNPHDARGVIGSLGKGSYVYWRIFAEASILSSSDGLPDFPA